MKILNNALGIVLTASLITGCRSSTSATSAPAAPATSPAPQTGSPVTYPSPVSSPSSPIPPPAPLPPPPADVLTQHNDNGRTGANLNETILSTSNVNPSDFGALYRIPVDGEIYAQPLYITNVDFGTRGRHNVLLVATMHNTLYAFDADTGEPLWIRRFGPSVPTLLFGKDYHDIDREVGILSTPVVDRSTLTVYCVAETLEGTAFSHHLHAVSLASGDELPDSPVEIQGSVAGDGEASVGGKVAFNSFYHLQRPGLLLTHGLIYVAFGSHNDDRPYHGWLFSYDASTLKQAGVFNTTPDSGGGAIWQSGQGPAADDSGSVYVATGNGFSSDATRRSEKPDSILRLVTAPSGLQLMDWFTAFNWLYLDLMDYDLGVTGTMLVPRTSLLVGGSKTGDIYVLNRDKLGRLQFNDSGAVQRIDGTESRIQGTMVFWQGPTQARFYVMAEGDYLKAFPLEGGRFGEKPDMRSTMTAIKGSLPGGILSISANGGAAGSGIVWASMVRSGVAAAGDQPGILRAFDAEDLSRELWNSEDDPSRDAVPTFAKFVPPTIANGKVYLATFSNEVVVYGLLN